jgi:preprotein translocase subunit YajC
VSIATLLPLILIIGVMFLMTRSARNKQRQAAEMRGAMAPGSGVRTIGGMYALVKSVNDDTVELEIAPGIFTHYAKNAIAAVLDQDEYARIVHGVLPEEPELAETLAEEARIDLAKEPGAAEPAVKDAAAEEGAAVVAEDAKPADLEKKQGEADAE